MDENASALYGRDEREGKPNEAPLGCCPLLTLGLTSGVGKARQLTCLGADCAWWNRKARRCVIVSGPER